MCVGEKLCEASSVITRIYLRDCVSIVALLPECVCERERERERERLCESCSVISRMCAWVSDCRIMVDSEPRKFSLLTWLRPRSRSPATRINQIQSIHVKIISP